MRKWLVALPLAALCATMLAQEPATPVFRDPSKPIEARELVAGIASLLRLTGGSLQ